MSIYTMPSPSASDITRAQCAHLTDLLEPWSIRKLAARTGLSKSAVESIYAGRRQITIADVQVLAPVLRMTPGELFDELNEATRKAPTPEGEGQKLPGLDSNQEPIGSEFPPVRAENVLPFPASRARRAPVVAREAAIVHLISRAAR